MEPANLRLLLVLGVIVRLLSVRLRLHEGFPGNVIPRYAQTVALGMDVDSELEPSLTSPIAGRVD